MINYFIALANICFVFVKFIFVSYGLNLFFLLYVINIMWMEKYFMIKTEGHVLVITIMQCPESNVVCLECDTEEEVYRLIRKMDCEITFAQPFHWRHSGQSVWRGRKADFFL